MAQLTGLYAPPSLTVAVSGAINISYIKGAGLRKCEAIDSDFRSLSTRSSVIRTIVHEAENVAMDATVRLTVLSPAGQKS